MDTKIFSARVLRWHEQAAVLALHQYRPWALAQLAEDMGCPRAFWASGSLRADAVHDLKAHGVGDDEHSWAMRPQSMTSWLQEARTSQYRIEFSCSEHPLSGLSTCIVLERDVWQPVFTESERTQLAMLGPHLLAAWRRCQQLQLYARSVAEGGDAGAVVDRCGFLQVADGRFYTLLRRSWPQWGGAQLPEDLCRLATTTGVDIVGGTRWSVTVADGLVFMTGRPLGALTLLKPREQMIALSLVAGASYRETASRYVLSPNTVRNNAARIFRKLGVRNRQELGLRLWATQAGTTPAQ